LEQIFYIFFVWNTNFIYLIFEHVYL
jgi:hypothetical protein